MLAIITSHPIQYQVPLWRALAADGRVPFEVWFLTPHGVAPSLDPEFGQVFAWDRDLAAGYPHRFVPVRPGWTIDRFRGIRLAESWEAQFRARGVTRVWIEGWRFSVLWTAAFAARRLGLPVWLRGENHDLAPESWRRRLWKGPLLRALFSGVDAFLVIGSANRRFYERLGVSRDRIHPAPYAVDNDAWRREADALAPMRARIREEWGVAADARCILFAGKLSDKKRPLDLVEAAALSGIPRLHLLFAGDGALRSALDARLSRPDAPPATFAGFLNLSQIARAYVAADALVLPSDYGETWGLVVNEALACGLPCAVSDRCGCGEDLVAPSASELVFRCGDPADLARALRRLVDEPRHEPGRRTIIDRHSLSATVETAARLAASSR
jgi:glycosyltransferase involved in cell wall biosynthesis